MVFVILTRRISVSNFDRSASIGHANPSANEVAEPVAASPTTLRRRRFLRFPIGDPVIGSANQSIIFFVLPRSIPPKNALSLPSALPAFSCSEAEQQEFLCPAHSTRTSRARSTKYTANRSRIAAESGSLCSQHAIAHQSPAGSARERETERQRVFVRQANQSVSSAQPSRSSVRYVCVADRLSLAETLIS